MYAHLRVTLLSVLSMVLYFAAGALAQTVQPSVAPPATAPGMPVPVPTSLEKLPPSAPSVSYDNGVLTISAYNSTLSDILRGIRSQTGADVDIPPQAEERVVTRLGPGSARDVVRTLLAGSRFNYILVGSNTDPNALVKVLLFPKLAADNAPLPLVNTAGALQQPRSLSPESNNVAEGMQQEDNSQEPPLPVRAQQQMLQQRRQTIMEAFQQNEQPESR